MESHRHTSAFVARAVRAKRPIRALKSKIGGGPVGLAAEQWPTCRQCGRAMDFLLQLDLTEPLRMSTKYRFAYFFMCHGYLDARDGIQCETFYPTTGANKIVLIECPARRTGRDTAATSSGPTMNWHLSHRNRRNQGRRRRA